MKESLSNAYPESVEPPEPDPFDEHEFRAWRGFLRVHRTVMDELARQLERMHDLTLLEYAVLITLVSAPGRRLRMSDLVDQVLTSPSGMTRAVARLRDERLVEREQDPDDLRSVIVCMIPEGLRRLREAQVTHHACIRELLFGGLEGDDLQRLATIYEHAMPGIVDEPVWPAFPPGHRSHRRTRRLQGRA